jgi:hypothetical protein
MPRPKKEKSDRRNVILQALVTEQQKLFVTSISADYGITQSRYIQMLIESQMKLNETK